MARATLPRPTFPSSCKPAGFGNTPAFIQRIQFWGAVLNGAPGHCYGTDSLWQMNSRKQPFGESVQGYTCGNWPWEEAMHWSGSTYVSVGNRILEKLPWWRFEPHPEWLSRTEEKDSEPVTASSHQNHDREPNLWSAVARHRFGLWPFFCFRERREKSNEERRRTKKATRKAASSRRTPKCNTKTYW